MKDEHSQRRNRNIWHLVLGILFIGYGSYRLYYRLLETEKDIFGIILAVGFIIFGIYDLYRYFKGV
ncbi:hypothetical protein [Zunongwangia sp. H14]|uniref:hypothetical protein n=1 Tax=Zunongwangia sp. H14 TaxID=3240792 RepID=UPI00356A8C17